MIQQNERRQNTPEFGEKRMLNVRHQQPKFESILSPEKNLLDYRDNFDEEEKDNNQNSYNMSEKKR